jgi:predicted nucleotidyltransferase component of viral defense system
MSVDYSSLASKLGFEERYVEKACRVSDLIRRISQVPFLRDRLCLYGGTALAFVFFPEIYRLSVDVDFNYRHLDVEDWGTVRGGIDEDLKRVLYSLGYGVSDLAIDASYPLGRITVGYTSRGGFRDSFKVEVGYMRRIPVLKEDVLEGFRHPAGGEGFKVLAPHREELFANKWCTMLYRGSSRDLFDVYRIAELPMNIEVFRVCAVVDSLMRGLPRLHEVDIVETVGKIPVDSGLLNLLRRGVGDFSPGEARRRVIEFSEGVLSSLTGYQRRSIDLFHEEDVFDPELIDQGGVLNPGIGAHPMIIRALQSKN